MENIILTINVILAVLLVIAVLLQKSEGGALGIGSSQDSYISSRSASNFLTLEDFINRILFLIPSNSFLDTIVLAPFLIAWLMNLFPSTLLPFIAKKI